MSFGGWRYEWSANRDGLDAVGGEAVSSLQLHVKLNSSWIIDAIISLIRRHTNAYFLLISWRHCASSLCASQSFFCLLSCSSKTKQLSLEKFLKIKTYFWLSRLKKVNLLSLKLQTAKSTQVPLEKGASPRVLCISRSVAKEEWSKLPRMIRVAQLCSGE